MAKIVYQKPILVEEDYFDDSVETNNSIEIEEAEEWIEFLGNYQQSPIIDSDFGEFIKNLIEERRESHVNPEKFLNSIIPTLEELVNDYYQYLR